MKLLRVHIISAETCGGLLDGLDLWLRSPLSDYATFDPVCLVGPNGAGKSQFLQVVAEIFQSIFNTCLSSEERVGGNPRLQFELEYLIRPNNQQTPLHIRISQKSEGKRLPRLVIQRKDEETYEWVNCSLSAPETHTLLPQKIVGYTSGGNETLSQPFLASRSGYAEEVGNKALNPETRNQSVPDTRLMLIDYGTHLEVLVANLLLGTPVQVEALLQDAKLQDLHSFRCIVRLAHPIAPKVSKKITEQTGRKGIQLTEELEIYLDRLQRCATCYNYDEKTETYIFDYWINNQTKAAFRFFWKNAINLYSSFHKLAMLNDFALSKKTRERFRRDMRSGRFASHLPEPQDEDKVFQFERVGFVAKGTNREVDYVSLSDGEHQLGQILGMFCMISFPSVLFLLDEPESHFNPQWRIKFISKVLDLPTHNGERRESSKVAEQECLITTHSPFLPSDMRRDKVFIFGKEEGSIVVRHPDIETFGTTFDTIIEECFGVRPPISQVPLDEIEELKKSNDPEEIKAGIRRLGDSVEKASLAHRLRHLKDRGSV